MLIFATFASNFQAMYWGECGWVSWDRSDNLAKRDPDFDGVYPILGEEIVELTKVIP
jgi:hypothetical protein